MDWTQKIRFLQSNGFTQQEIADYVGCSQSYIGLLATGARGSNISFSIAQKIIDMCEKLPERPRNERNCN